MYMYWQITNKLENNKLISKQQIIQEITNVLTNNKLIGK